MSKSRGLPAANTISALLHPKEAAAAPPAPPASSSAPPRLQEHRRPAAGESAPRPAPRSSSPAPSTLTKYTITLPAELLERLQNAVFAKMGPPDCLTVRDVAEGALRAAVERLEKKHNDGEPFPSRAQALRRGRR